MAALPIMMVTRLEYEPRSTGVMPVSPVTQRTRSGVDAEHLGDDRRQHVVRALPELGRAAEHGHLPAAVQQQLHARMRQLVPVDRQAGAAHVGAAGEAEAAAVGLLAIACFPVRAHDNFTDAFGKTGRADAQPVRGERIRLGDHAQAQLRRVELELLGDLVELHFLAEARLRRAVAALGAAGRLVGEGAAGLELETRQLVGHRRQHAGVEGARRTVRAVAAAVEQRLQVHGGELAVLRDAGAHLHQHRVPAAVLVEHLFARQADFHRAAQHQRRLGDHHLVVGRIALAAEAAAVGRGDDADLRRGHLQHARQLPVQVVRVLRARADQQLAVALHRGERRLLLPSAGACCPGRRRRPRRRGRTAPAPRPRRRTRRTGCGGCCPARRSRGSGVRDSARASSGSLIVFSFL